MTEFNAKTVKVQLNSLHLTIALFEKTDTDEI